MTRRRAWGRLCVLWRVLIRCDLRFGGCVLAARGDEREKDRGVTSLETFFLRICEHWYEYHWDTRNDKRRKDDKKAEEKIREKQWRRRNQTEPAAERWSRLPHAHKGHSLPPTACLLVASGPLITTPPLGLVSLLKTCLHINSTSSILIPLIERFLALLADKRALWIRQDR